ncbi:MAG: hypothetical protein FJX31_11360, partial [Alphaproteobacteria bacterium]|nr:hypothetical protein [Alphaproteobacteria bacterium]
MLQRLTKIFGCCLASRLAPDQQIAFAVMPSDFGVIDRQVFVATVKNGHRIAPRLHHVPAAGRHEALP